MFSLLSRPKESLVMARSVNLSLCSQRQGDPTSLLKVQSLTHLLKNGFFIYYKNNSVLEEKLGEKSHN